MSNPLRYAATAAFMLVVLVSGLAHGFRTYRWEAKPSLDEYVGRLKQIPMTFGDWNSEINNNTDNLLRGGLEIVSDPVTNVQELRFMDNLKAHGIEDYILRDYRNRKTTESYRVLVVVGRPGPIAAHTPDVCYRGAGFTQIGEQGKADVIIDDEASPQRGRKYPLNLMKFKPPSTRVDGREMQTRWAWMAPGGLIATPGSPRIEYASQPALYKVYISHEPPLLVNPAAQSSNARADTPIPTVATHTAQDPSKFLKAFLPQLEDALKNPVAR